MSNWQKILKQLKLEHLKATAPGFFEASGGYDMDIKPYTDKTSNGLTKAIIDFLVFNGHYANRISTQGQARPQDIPRFNIFTEKVVSIGKKVTWTKGSTRKGTPDIDAIINGHPTKIEVKVGRDSMSDDQNDERGKIEAAGGLYFIARDMDCFITWYNELTWNPAV